MQIVIFLIVSVEEQEEKRVERDERKDTEEKQTGRKRRDRDRRGSTTGFYMAKLDEICYQVCFSSWRDVYETIQNPEFQNPAIGGF